jgi:hypothetical protein
MPYVVEKSREAKSPCGTAHWRLNSEIWEVARQWNDTFEQI